MALFCFCALAGAYTLQLCSELPGPVQLTVVAAVSLATFLVPRLRLVGAFLSGFIVLAVASQSVIDDRLSPDLVGKTIKIDVRVTDFPKDNGASLSFQVIPIGRDDLPRRIRLSWFNAPIQPALGETWQFELRLRRPRGYTLSLTTDQALLSVGHGWTILFPSRMSVTWLSPISSCTHAECPTPHGSYLQAPASRN